MEIKSGKAGFLRGFLHICITNSAGRISVDAMGGHGAHSAPFCVLKSLKRRV
jgi:hypothetical protein